MNELQKRFEEGKKVESIEKPKSCGELWWRWSNRRSIGVKDCPKCQGTGRIQGDEG